MPKERIFRAYGFPAAQTITESRPVLHGRARQAIHVTGYRMGLFTSNPALTNAQTMEYALALMAAGQQGKIPTTAVSAPADFQRFYSGQETIDLLTENIRMYAAGATTGALQEFGGETDWVVCDFNVPAIHLVLHGVANPTPNWDAWCVIEFEWVTMEVAELAALMFNWGQDPQDFDGRI